MRSERHRRHTAKSLDEIAPPHSDGIVTVQPGIREGVGGVAPRIAPRPCTDPGMRSERTGLLPRVRGRAMNDLVSLVAQPLFGSTRHFGSVSEPRPPSG